MSRAYLVLSAAAIFSASTFLALADEKRVLASAMESGARAANQKSDAKPREHGDRAYRHYRSYDEALSAMIAPAANTVPPTATSVSGCLNLHNGSSASRARA